MTLHCNTTGDPDPDFVWTSPGGAVIGTDHTGYQADHVGFLNIASVSVETDAGDWKCEACNPIGCDSSSISLLVEGKNIYLFVHSFIHSSFIHSFLVSSFHFILLEFNLFLYSNYIKFIYSIHMDIWMDR